MEHKFQIHLRGLIDLLSNHLYNEPDVFVRAIWVTGLRKAPATATLEGSSSTRGLRTLCFQPGRSPIAVPLARALVHRLALAAERRDPSTRTARALHQADSAVTAVSRRTSPGAGR